MTMKKNKSKSAASRVLSESHGYFPVVAIGASAGGLEAMMELLQHLPSDTGMAFIYVQHLSPDHKSMLTEILSKKTKMKVQEIDDMDKITPNNVFVIPYNKGIEVTDGHIKLIPRSESSSAISIDTLFSSLAKAQKERVIGIILSGSASDGTLGVKAIKQEGGLTFAQNETAKFKSMPHSAIATGMIDFILPPKEMALELTRLSKHPFVKTPKNRAKMSEEDLIDNNNPDLKIILNQLYKTTEVDFSVYKMNTIKRRIIRRMLLYKIATLKQYAELLAQKKEEIDILYQDLLINVTSFFRDTETHKYLKTTLLPKLLKRKKEGESLRIWVPACATGEEVYSIAMMLLEIQESNKTTIPVQIFATDLSEQAISKARIGVYTIQDLESVSPNRIQQFFTKLDGGFLINKAVREICVFAQHNILRDPPFSRLDFISCCNLFIYLDTAAQKKAINTFHYALNSDGYLMLGKSENISQSTNLFTSSNSKYKIFSRKINSGFQRLPELSPRMTKQNTIPEKNFLLGQRSKTHINVSATQLGLENYIDEVLVSEFMPASVVINHQMEIVQFRGSTDLFLTHPKGRATFNILKMARPEIAFELRNAISKAIKTQQRIRKTGIELISAKSGAEVKIISIEVFSLDIDWNEPLLLIIFAIHEQAEMFLHQANNGKDNTTAIEAAKDKKIKKLEQELATAHADALSIAQEQEAFTEELQSAHEEVVSSNEELQTVNEELETSKEEIESANEELTTTNQELQTRNDLLSESYEYSNAIVSTMHEPMLVLGKDLRVKSANKAFYKNFGVTEEQTEGVLLYDLGNKQWNIPALQELLEDIIPKNAQFYNYEVKHTFLNIGEKIMSLNASRVIQKTHREQLILLVISDITEVRRLIVEKELIEKELLNKEIRNRKAEKIKLEKAVGKRTEELKIANESLDKRNAELLNLNKELEAFAYVSSHDLQEPLRKLQIFAGLILAKESQNLSDDGKEYFRLMQQAAERMQQLIQDLLAFSRITIAERKFKKTDLQLIIEDVKREFKEALAEKHAIIDVKEICDVCIIPFQFRQLMHNLISNALKFSNPEIPPRITISCKTIAHKKLNIEGLNPQKEYCHISFADNGIGFEKEFSEKIFEVFQKLHGKEEYAGTGIGLAIVKKIIDNHNGIITATSELNKGTTFNIYLPIIQTGIAVSQKN
jgi:two-component system, chemotaxis family, CheB/CheR fusion protein